MQTNNQQKKRRQQHQSLKNKYNLHKKINFIFKRKKNTFKINIFLIIRNDIKNTVVLIFNYNFKNYFLIIIFKYDF